jgi:hypothetical protein
MERLFEGIALDKVSTDDHQFHRGDPLRLYVAARRRARMSTSCRVRLRGGIPGVHRPRHLYLSAAPGRWITCNLLKPAGRGQ